MMDSLRRTLVLGLPIVAVTGLQGCGGAENDAQDKATAQSADHPAQAESTVASGGNFSIRNRNSSNFPFLNGTFDLSPLPNRVQAVINPGSPGGLGPVLALQLSTTRPAGTDMLVAEMSLAVKLANPVPTGSSNYDLGSGGALVSDALLTCRQISADGSVKSYAYRIVVGTLAVSQIDLASGTAVVSLRDVIANAAVGFGNLAQGSITVLTNAPVTLRAVLENSGSQLS